MSEYKSYLQNISIRWRFWSLLLLFITVMLIVWGTSFVGLSTFKQAKSEQKFYAGLLKKQQELDVLALQLRRNEKDFLLRKDLSYADRYYQNHKDVLDKVKQLNALVQDQQVEENLKTFRKNIITHKAGFADVVEGRQTLGLNEKDGLEGQLRNAVHSVEETLNAHSNDGLKVVMLMLRRHEKDFIMRKASKYVDRFAKRQQIFLNLLDQADFPEEVKQSLNSKLNAYGVSFKSFSDIQLKLVQDIDLLSSSYAAAVEELPRVAIYAQNKMKTVEESFNQASDDLSSLINVTIIISLLFFTGLAFYIIRTTVSELMAVQSALYDISEGDYDVSIPYTAAKSEVGSIAGATERLRNNARERMALEAKVAKEKLDQAEEKRIAAEEAERQRRERFDEEKIMAEREQKTKAISDLIHNFENTIEKHVGALAMSAADMRATSEDMVSIADMTGGKATSVKNQSEDMQGNINSMAAAIEEFSTTINEVGGQVRLANQSSVDAVQAAKLGNVAIEKLSTVSGRIEDVVRLINDIAEQTNLLALNATIEAARAGDAGKGFAVVASEVKNLATQTANATGDISAQINDMQTVTHEAVQSIQSVSNMVNTLNTAVLTISSAVEQQEASTNEISRNVQFTAQGASHVNKEVHEVSEGAGRTGQASSDVMSAAKDLEDLSTVMTDEINTFLKNVRAVS